MLRDLIGKRVRVINKHAKRYGQVGTIVGIQRNDDAVEIDESVLQGEVVEVDPSCGV